MITIKQTNNGCVVEYDNNMTFVYGFSEDNIERLKDMMADIMEQVEPTNSRYSKQRLQVSIVHGDKYECKDKKCDICK